MHGAGLAREGTARPPAFAFDDVSFSFPDGNEVVDGLSLEVPEGSIIGVVGPSGCGKSTLLSLVADVLAPTTGKVLWSPTPAAAGRHPLTMMFQKDTLLPWLTVADNIGLHWNLTRSKLPKETRRERVRDLARLVGLESAMGRYPYQLSGGMRRRTAFLTTVAPLPHILLLDEPFSALDEPTRIGIHQDIFDIVRRDGITVLLVTHDLAEAISLADEVVVLTARPARVFARHSIPFGDERNMLELRELPEFLELYGHLWEQLAVQIERSRAGEEGPA